MFKYFFQTKLSLLYWFIFSSRVFNFQTFSYFALFYFSSFLQSCNLHLTELTVWWSNLSVLGINWMLALRMKSWCNYSGSLPCFQSGWRWKLFWIWEGILAHACVIFRWVFEFSSIKIYLTYLMSWDNQQSLSESPFIHLQCVLHC